MAQQVTDIPIKRSHIGIAGGISISEDFLPAIRAAPKKLLEFARAEMTPFKLRFSKLTIGDKLYRVDDSSGSVMEEKKRT